VRIRGVSTRRIREEQRRSSGGDFAAVRTRQQFEAVAKFGREWTSHVDKPTGQAWVDMWLLLLLSAVQTKNAELAVYIRGQVPVKFSVQVPSLFSS
jgi:hypothetical protein